MTSSFCKSCRARIVWMKTAAGRSIPVDAATVNPDQETFDPLLGHISHFATCPDASQHRRRK